MQTYFNGSNINTKTTVASRLGFRFGYDVTNRITAFWNRTPNDSLQENVLGAKPNSPGLDLIDEIGASYKLARNWTVGAESYRRWRQCCPGAGDPKNPNPLFENGFSLFTNVGFGPDTIIGKPFSFTLAGIDFAHRTNPAAIANGLKRIGVSDEGSKWVSTETLLYRIPVFHQRKFVPFVSIQQLVTYFTSSVEPTYSNAVNYGVTIAPSRMLSFTFSIRNFNEHNLGYPFAPGNVQHYTWFLVAANIHGRI